MQTDLRKILFDHLAVTPDACAGKVAVVTGGGRGIGLQTARAFALAGAHVVIAEISDEGRQAEALICAEGDQALFVRTDVADEHSVVALHEQALRAFGRVDYLVNNAIRCPVMSAIEMPVQTWDAVIAVNLRGVFLTCRTFLPGMLAQRSGVVVNMVSTEAMPGLSAYIASKQAILGFSQSLAQEVQGSGVSVIPFGPGMVDTPSIHAVSTDLAPRLGMTADQFLHFSLHPAYDGLMPPEHAGAATLYLALRLAEEFHGMPVNGYEVLERAGFLPSTMPAPAAAASEAVPVQERGDAKETLAAFAQLLDDTRSEMEKLPIFVRPLARQGFKGKAGASLEDWQRQADRWRTGLETTGALPHGEDLPARLDRLAAYYRGVPAETARFTRDATFLREVEVLSVQRVQLTEQVKALCAALKREPR